MLQITASIKEQNNKAEVGMITLAIMGTDRGYTFNTFYWKII